MLKLSWKTQVVENVIRYEQLKKIVFKSFNKLAQEIINELQNQFNIKCEVNCDNDIYSLSVENNIKIVITLDDVKKQFNGDADEATEEQVLIAVQKLFVEQSMNLFST
jgi:hypothetical protein